MGKIISASQVSRHNSPDDVWIVVNGKVYDMTEFAPEHPGGAKIIYQYAGSDASQRYNEVHSVSLIQKELDAKFHLGTLDESTIPAEWKTAAATSKKKSSGVKQPSLEDIINLDDFEKAAQMKLSPKSWAYINGAANDNITRDANREILKRIWLRPAILRNVGTVRTDTKLFGCKLSMPVYISATGAVKTASPDGELALAKGAHASGSILMMATPSSYTHEEILKAVPERAFFQLYVNKQREKSEAAIQAAVATGKIKALFVTVDLPVISKREADERIKLTEADYKLIGNTTPSLLPNARGIAAQNATAFDSNVSWDDLKWLRGITNVPIILKGVQRAQDAVMALEAGCQGIVLSNHGGRAADNAPPAILTLLELHKNCPQVFGAMEILVDGGFRRGSDVVKAICLGASAVGIGRPTLYSLGYGVEGVKHAMNILQDEINTCMRLIGLTDLMRDAHPDYVNTGEIDHLVPGMTHPYARKPARRIAKL